MEGLISLCLQSKEGRGDNLVILQLELSTCTFLEALVAEPVEHLTTNPTTPAETWFDP